MADYVPMSGPFPGKRYEPSNGTEGACFIEAWCCECERDKEMNGTCHEEGRDPDEDDWCPILGASYRGEAVEWRELEDGELVCLGFVKRGTPQAAARCEHTMELPLGEG